MLVYHYMINPYHNWLAIVLVTVVSAVVICIAGSLSGNATSICTLELRVKLTFIRGWLTVMEFDVIYGSVDLQKGTREEL